MYENLAAGSLTAAGARDAGPEYAEPSRQLMVDYDAEKGGAGGQSRVRCAGAAARAA